MVECACKRVVDEGGSALCSECHEIIPVIARYQETRNLMAHRLEELQAQITNQSVEKLELINQIADLTREVKATKALVTAGEAETQRLQRDLDVLGEKLVDEIEQRAELQHAKEAIQEELEELSKSLFEEANGLVADEARKRHFHQQKEQALREEVARLTAQTALDHQQLAELKLKLEEMAEQIRTLEAAQTDGLDHYTQDTNEVVDTAAVPQFQEPGDMFHNGYDPALLKDFQTMLASIQSVKINKLSSLSFFKSVVEEEIEICLRFGGNRVLPRKLLDAIASNSCYIQKSTVVTQTATTSNEVVRDDARSSSSADEETKPPRAETPRTAPPPTSVIFAKSLSERFSSFSIFASGSNVSSPSGSMTNLFAPVANCCSTCGRTGHCQFQFKTTMEPEDIWYPICSFCRDKLAAVCDFYAFVRGLQANVYRNRTDHELLLECMGLRKNIFATRIGAKVEFDRTAKGSNASSRYSSPSPKKNLKQKYTNLLNEEMEKSPSSSSLKSLEKRSSAPPTLSQEFYVRIKNLDTGHLESPDLVEQTRKPPLSTKTEEPELEANALQIHPDYVISQSETSSVEDSVDHQESIPPVPVDNQSITETTSSSIKETLKSESIQKKDTSVSENTQEPLNLE